MKSSTHSFGFVAAVALMLGGALFAQNPGVQRTIVTRADISTPGKEAVIVRIEFPVGASAGRHTHFGEEISYVIEGEGELLIDGQPPRKIKAGDGVIVPAGAIHDARNTGSVPLKLSGVFVVDKGKPLSTPAQ
jgi:quercetin dioxygenase-like cupin family protein